MKSEPVITAAAISGLVMAFLTMAVSLGWVQLSPEQMKAVEQFVLPAVAIFLPIVAAIFARRLVTPTANPKTATGEPAAIVPLAQAQAMGFAPPAGPEGKR